MNSRTARIAFSVAISAIFLGLAVRNVKWQETADALHTAEYLYLLPVMAAAIWTLYIRAQRWRVFLKPIGVPPLRRLVNATNIGFMANMVLPLRAGEVIRPLLVSRREGIPLGGVLATVLLERIFDMFTILLMFGTSVLLVQVTDEAKSWGWMLTGLAVGVAVLIGILRWQEERALALVRRIAELLPPRPGQLVQGFMSGFVRALDILNSPSDFLRALAWSAYLWLAIAAMNGFGLLAFHLPLQSAVIITAIVAIAVSVPSAPGYIGSFQIGCIVGLAIFHIPKGEALAFSFVLHLAQFVATVAAGLYSLWSENMSLREVDEIREPERA